MFSNVGCPDIHPSGDHPSWQRDIDSIEWLAFRRLFTTVETLHVSGRLASQAARALTVIPGEMAAEVLPSLQLLDNTPVGSTEHESMQESQHATPGSGVSFTDTGPSLESPPSFRMGLSSLKRHLTDLTSHYRGYPVQEDAVPISVSLRRVGQRLEIQPNL
ncbi:hypothetical protein EDB89DRAFT_2075785 [Lactarius sanguifluus]|nr:hypothetical protein EDB89DRAFT_2075785 [Lactarius sanguifluus]